MITPEQEKQQLTLASQYLNNGDFARAEQICSQVLAQNPKQFNALALIGVIANNLKRYDLAVKFLGESLEINSSVPNYNFYMGNALTGAKRDVDAIPYYEKALKNKVENLGLYSNLAVGYLKRNQLKKALQLYRRGMKLVPTSQDDLIMRHYLGYAEAIHVSGDIEEAIRITEEGLQFETTSILRVGLLVYAAVRHWSLGDAQKAEYYMSQCQGSEIESQLFKKDFEMQAMTAFYIVMRYITAPAQMKTVPPKDEEATPLYMVGDSHCLSPAWRYVTYKGEKVQVVPKLVIGCKVFHLTNEKPDPRKDNYLRTIDKLPAGSTYIMSVGEIDCRIDEGILQAHKKKGLNYAETMPAFIEKFVNFVVVESEKRSLTPIFAGVPAPGIRDKEVSDLERMELAQLILCYNETLKAEAKKKSCAFIDVHAATVGDQGFSNNLYHFDAKHLKAEFISDAFEKYFMESV